MADPRVAFLDANVLRGQLTTDVVLSLADNNLYEPQWSAQVLAEVKRNRPAGVTAERADARFARMADAFPEAMITDYEHLMPEMRADEKDKHVLAAAVHGEADVLVTENTKDFNPPTDGPHAMKVERTSEFVNHLLDEHPVRVIAAMQQMVDRNRRTPQTLSELIDKMSTQQDLKGFAHKLNAVVPPEQRGTHVNLQTTQAAMAALDGVAPPQGAITQPTEASKARKNLDGPEKSADKEL
jgi:predicted nucleic acid-binding protein